jgi:hypothetical protein
MGFVIFSITLHMISFSFCPQTSDVCEAYSLILATKFDVQSDFWVVSPLRSWLVADVSGGHTDSIVSPDERKCCPLKRQATSERCQHPKHYQHQIMNHSESLKSATN